MAKSKVDMIEEMKLLAEKMSPVTELAKLETSRLLLPAGCEELRADFIRPGYKWLLEIEQLWIAVKKAQSYCDPDVWEMYSALGEEDLIEVKDLKQALHAFRTAVVSRKRPDFYKTTKRATLLRKKDAK